MINGIMTLSGAWHRLRTDPILKFLVVAVSFYGMSTFEGSMKAIRKVNTLTHNTDWTVGHVHTGSLGWVAMVTFGSLYYMIPRLYGRAAMARPKWVELHFWLATLGVVLYISAMWISGVMQGLMWRATGEDGMLVYSFVEGVKATYPFYAIRALGGLMFWSGAVLMLVNTLMTIQGQVRVNPVVPLKNPGARKPSLVGPAEVAAG